MKKRSYYSGGQSGTSKQDDTIKDDLDDSIDIIAELSSEEGVVTNLHVDEPVEIPVEIAEIPVKVEPAEREITTISRQTVITGELSAPGDAHIYGKIKGNVNADGNVEVAGKIIGNVTGNDVDLSRCELKGNVNAKGFIFMDKDSLVIGDTYSQDITLDGKIKGNINAIHKVYVRSNAVIIGNIKAASIAIDEGASLQGEVTITQTGDRAMGESIDIAE